MQELFSIFARQGAGSNFTLIEGCQVLVEMSGTSASQVFSSVVTEMDEPVVLRFMKRAWREPVSSGKSPQSGAVLLRRSSGSLPPGTASSA